MAGTRGNPNWKRGGKSPNPRGRAGKARWDDWQSTLTGLGVSTYDKRLSVTHVADRVSSAEAQELWRGDDLAARVVETWPNEALRQGWDLQVKDDDEFSGRVTARAEELGVDAAVWTALAYERAYGGGAVVLGANDGASSLAEPLRLERVSRLDWVMVAEPRELTATRYYSDPGAARFGEPSVYRFQPHAAGVAGSAAVDVHESRLIVFPGIRVSRLQVSEYPGWGDSALTRVLRVLRDFNLSWGAAGVLVSDFAQAVYKVAGLNELLALGNASALKAKVAATELSRSVVRATMIDAQDDFERKQTPLSGLPDLLDRFATRLAASADMPLTLLMGQSPAGLNATGDSDIRFFYDRVKAFQTRKIRPALERIVIIIARSIGLDEPEQWSLVFHPLWQPSDQEQAATRLAVAQADAIYIANGVLSPEEVAVSRFGGDGYSMDTVVDFDARSAVDDLETEQTETEQTETEQTETEQTEGDD